jgi:dolichyl-diphosphooligosaccharide--protein glycosyltransferase
MMGRPYETTRQFLDERPDHEDTIDAIVDLDADGPWAFDDVPCDSGVFGEIVSREFVESVDDGYRLVDREETRAAVEGEPLESADEETSSQTDSFSLSGLPPVLATLRSLLPDRSRDFHVAVVVSALFLFVMRAVLYNDVFRGEHVVFAGNDPYHYRYEIDQLLAADIGLLDFEAIGQQAGGDILTPVVGWWLTETIGMSPTTSGALVAWLPVVFTTIAGLLLIWTALAVTKDERIAVLSAVALAVTPGHAQYTLIGFYDHHALDYLWLAIMVAALVWLARDVERDTDVIAHLESRGTWGAAVAFGVATGAAMLSWTGAPLLLLGVAGYAVLRAVSDVRSDSSPLLVGIPLFTGLGLAAVIGHLFHSSYGWSEAAVVYAPAVVLLGALAITFIAELCWRYYPDPRVALGGSIVTGGLSVFAVQTIAPGIWSRYSVRFSRALLGRKDIVETRGLISPEFLFSFGPIQQFGLLLLFALPVLAYVTWRCVDSHEPAWLVIVGYGWAYLALMAIQVRFSGEFAPFGAIFAAAGILWGLGRLGMCYPPTPFREGPEQRIRLGRVFEVPEQSVYVAFVIVTVVTIGLLYSVVLMGVVTIDNSEYDAAAWVAEDSDDDDYVLSRWGRNRMYNYFVSGESSGYGYARSNFAEFLQSDEPDEWYSRFNGRVQYIVVSELDLQDAAPPELTELYGRFRLSYVTPGETKAVYRPVPGAKLTGQSSPNSVFGVESSVSVGEYDFTYQRQVRTNETGRYSARLAYPGRYTVAGDRTGRVTEAAVEQGYTVREGVEARDIGSRGATSGSSVRTVGKSITTGWSSGHVVGTAPNSGKATQAGGLIIRASS